VKQNMHLIKYIKRNDHSLSYQEIIIIRFKIINNPCFKQFLVLFFYVMLKSWQRRLFPFNSRVFLKNGGRLSEPGPILPDFSVENPGLPWVSLYSLCLNNTVTKETMHHILILLPILKIKTPFLLCFLKIN